MREIFFKEHITSTEKDIIDELHYYDSDFHIFMIKDCIEYVFNILTNHEISLMEYHYVALKLMHIYTSLGYIIYASDVSDTRYAKYITGETGYERMLLNKEKNLLDDSFYSFDRFDSLISASNRLPDTKVAGIIKKKAKITKVSADILPVGYSISTSTAYEYNLYDPVAGWIPRFEPLFSMPAKENDIIIGYDIDVQGILGKKFKLRKPIEIVADKRTVSKGMSCVTHKKEDLLLIAKRLGISIDVSKIKLACGDIKKELMKREIESRRSADGIKWFYFSLEYNPIKH
jgi:hypothetical protein